MLTALRPSCTCDSIQDRCGSHAQVLAALIVTARPTLSAGGRGGGLWVAAGATYDAECKLPRIDLRGAEHWNKPVFQFLGNVPKAFRLADLFVKYMADPFVAYRKHR